MFLGRGECGPRPKQETALEQILVAQCQMEVARYCGPVLVVRNSVVDSFEKTFRTEDVRKGHSCLDRLLRWVGLQFRPLKYPDAAASWCYLQDVIKQLLGKIENGNVSLRIRMVHNCNKHRM